MACPNLDFESDFLKAITASPMKVSIENNILKLERGNNLLEFKRK